jgi:hypothetical protein
MLLLGILFSLFVLLLVSVLVIVLHNERMKVFKQKYQQVNRTDLLKDGFRLLLFLSISLLILFFETNSIVKRRSKKLENLIVSSSEVAWVDSRLVHCSLERENVF